MQWWGRFLCSIGIHLWHDGYFKRYCLRRGCDAVDSHYKPDGEDF